MSYLCFGNYAKIIKNATLKANVAVVDLLTDCLVPNSSKLIHPTDKQKMFKAQKYFGYLQEAALSNGLKDCIYERFEKNIVPELPYIKTNEIIELLKALIIGDTSIVETDKKELLLNADKEHYTEFLSKAFLFAATRPNDLKDNTLPTPLAKNIISISDGKIFLNGEEVPLPDKLTPPEKLESEETTYIISLLKAFADKQKVESYTIETLPVKYQNELQRHRQDYFNAEAVHRKVREIYSDNDNQFEILKNETYDGVIDTALMTYSDGYEKLLKVLAQAVQLNHGKSLLWQLPEWLSSSEKKGICHILVNDKRITWVAEDE